MVRKSLERTKETATMVETVRVELEKKGERGDGEFGEELEEGVWGRGIADGVEREEEIFRTGQEWDDESLMEKCLGERR